MFYLALSKLMSHLGINEKKKKKYCQQILPVTSAHMGGFCCVLMTSKFREFRPKWGADAQVGEVPFEPA